MRRIQSIDELSNWILTRTPSLYCCSQTSTVIPFHLNQSFNLELVQLNGLPKAMRLVGEDLIVSGPVTWQEAQDFLRENGRDLATYPTEKLAAIIAGVATSCTGERSFRFGAFREQIKAIKAMNYSGEIVELSSDKKIEIDNVVLSAYQKTYTPFKQFKNAPFPRLENEADLMIGTEGQLGVVLEVRFETISWDTLTTLALPVQSWRESDDSIEVCRILNEFRSTIYSCELIDHECFHLAHERNPAGSECDVIFLEMPENRVEWFCEETLETLNPHLNGDIIQMEPSQMNRIRAAIPRAVNEYLSRHQTAKKGTDVQVSLNHFNDLIKFYRKALELGEEVILFGHFGDCHLHLNILPKDKNNQHIEKYLLDLYGQAKNWEASPFAEHGIGLVKQPFIKEFYHNEQKEMWKVLKSSYDPYGQFFPTGFMSLVQTP